MHELALAESLKKEIVKIAEQRQLKKIISVTLEIGEFSGVDRDALDFALPFVCEDVPLLRDVRFIYEKIRVEVACNDCGKNSCPEIPVISCAECGSVNVQVVSGRDFMIKNMEVQ